MFLFLNKYKKMHGKIELLVVWLFSFMTFITMSNLVGFFAIVASITSIIRNLPYLEESIKKFIKTLKK
jgi:hypothetical protein